MPPQQWGQQPAPQPVPPAKKKGHWYTSRPVIGIAAGIIGIIIGTNAAGGSTDATAEPEATATVTATATKTVTAKAKPAEQPKEEETKEEAPKSEGKSSFGDGTWIVGKDIKPGVYRATDTEGLCYWERDKDLEGTFDSIIANGNGPGTQTVQIKKSDAAFNTARCGTWTKIG